GDIVVSISLEVGIRAPYKGSPFQLPGKIEAGYYDFGGQGLAYNDNTSENTGNAVFRNDNVDIDIMDRDSNIVVEFEEGEWLTYTVNIPNGFYDIALRIATVNDDCQIEINLLDSLNAPTFDTLALIDVANSGNLSTFRVVNFNDIDVSDGGDNKILLVKVLSGSCSFDWLIISSDRTGHLLNNTPGSLSEAVPFGVPSNWSWVTAASEPTLDKEDNYTHTNFWGAIFRNNNNATPANSVVQIANCSYYILYNDSTEWTYIQGQETALGGSTFSPTYHGQNIDPEELGHTDEGMFIVPAEGNIYHFWYGPGYELFLFNDVKAVIVNMQSRLVLKDPGGVDDRKEAGYLIHVGSDWRDPNDPGCSATNYVCPGFGVGKLDSITIQWRNHSFHSLSEEDILNGVIPLPPDSIFYTLGNHIPESWILKGSLLTGEEELIYQEDFNENKLNGWIPVTGTWNVSGSRLNNPTATADEVVYYGNATFQNFIVTAEGIPSWNNDFGLVYNYQDKDNYYVLTVDPTPPIARLQINHSGVFDTIAEKEYPVGGNTVFMEVKHDRSKTAAFVNGQQIFKNIVTDEFGSGHIGAYAWWCPMKFDNFNVYAALNSDSSMTIVSTPHNTPISNTIKIFPNPTCNYIIHLTSDESAINATVSIFSINGNLISSKVVDIINITTFELDPGLGKGIYFLEVITN
ncbi:MAG: T9SS type A sorting domain-containing protein, partial [Bacteroidales bacterium]|nr:T9SS type A sorting domain-containing protein [Bacteroidales bacterium]